MKYEHYTPEAVILANGEYPSHPLPLQMLKNAEFVVCCDGAANEYILRGHTPDVIIGDGDSLSPEYKELFSPTSDSGSRNERPNQSCSFPAKERIPKNCHCRSHRQTGRSYIRKHQSADRLHERWYRGTYHYRLWYVYPRQRHASFRLSSGATSFYFQFRSERIARRGISLSS